MRLFIICFIALVSFGTSFSQNIFKVGPKTQKKFKGSLSYFDTQSKVAYAISRNIREQLQVALVDQNYLHLRDTVKTLAAEIFSGKGTITYYYMHRYQNRCYVVYSTTDKKAKELNLYVQELSPEIVLLGSAIKITSVSSITGGFSFLSDLSIGYSRDGKFLVFAKNLESSLEVRSFRFDTGEKWSKVFNLDQAYSNSLRKAVVDTEGNIYLLGKYYKKEIDKGPFVLVVSSRGDKYNLNTVPTEDKTLHLGYNISLVGDQVVAAGLYVKEKKEGYEIFRVNFGTMKLEPFATQPVTENFHKLINIGAYEPRFFSVSGITQLKNGTLVLSIEGGVISGTSKASSTYASQAYVFSVDEKGVEKWNTIIEKPQVQPLAGDLTGHVFVSIGDKVYLIYNDNLDNFEKAPTDKADGWLLKRKTYVAVVEIDETGKAKKMKWIAKSKEETSSFLPESLHRIDNGLFHLTFTVGDNSYFATFAGND